MSLRSSGTSPARELVLQLLDLQTDRFLSVLQIDLFRSLAHGPESESGPAASEPGA